MQRINAAFPPPGAAIAGIEAIARLGHALDGVDRPHTADAVFAAMAAAEPAFKGLSLATLGGTAPTSPARLTSFIQRGS